MNELVGRLGGISISIWKDSIAFTDNDMYSILLDQALLDDFIKLIWKARNMIQPKAVLCRECRYYLPRRCGLDNHVVSGKKALCTRGVKKE